MNIPSITDQIFFLKKKTRLWKYMYLCAGVHALNPEEDVFCILSLGFLPKP